LSFFFFSQGHGEVSGREDHRNLRQGQERRWHSADRQLLLVSSPFQLVTHCFPGHTLPRSPHASPPHSPTLLPSLYSYPSPLHALITPSFNRLLPWIIPANALLAHVDHPIPSTPSLYLQILPLIAFTIPLPLATPVIISLFRLPKEATGKPPSISQTEYDNTPPTRMFCHKRKRVLTPNLVSQWRMLHSWVGRKA
jgi:hypothetical protein